MSVAKRLFVIDGAPSQARSLLLSIIFGAGAIFGLIYHFIAWSTGETPGLFLAVAFHAASLAAYGSIWLLLADYFARRRPPPARSLWTLILFSVGVVVLSAGVMLVARPTDVVDLAQTGVVPGFDHETGVPIVAVTVFQMGLLGVLQGVFSVLVMLILRDLVLVKRTRGSQRNWRLMVGLMVGASLSVAGNAPGDELHELQVIMIIAAVVMMLVNSFRLSWIVFLSFRNKMIAAGLCTLLLAVLLAAVGIMSDSALSQALAPGRYAFLSLFSLPLALFTSLSTTFGVLYCTTALLSLLFHLPTSGEFQARSGQRTAMQMLTNIVGDVFDAERLFATIASSPVEAGSAQMAWLALTDDASGGLRPRIVGASGITAERIEELLDTEALYEDLQESGQPVILEHAVADHRVRARPGDGIGSLVIAPLTGRGRLLGALFAAKDVVRGFERDEVEIITVLASQAALAIENSRLLEERVESERLARELAIAREVQKRLLPQRVPEIPGLSIAASSVPAQEVGGDYYDFVVLADDRLGVIIADVSGKGTSAAFYMAEMQGIFQAVSRLAPSPADFLHHANVALADSLERSTFISVIYGVIDVTKEEFVLARAGHCPAACIDVHGEARYLRSDGIGLGLDRTGLFRRTLVETRHRLRPGDVFALYTDGVIESRNGDGEEYGYERLMEVLRENRHEDVGDLHDAVIKDLNRFVGYHEYGDDMTLVVLKWHGIADLSNVHHMARLSVQA